MIPSSSSELIRKLAIYAREKKQLTCSDTAKKLECEYIYHWKVENGVKGLTFERLDDIIDSLGYTQETFWMLLPEFMDNMKNQQANDSTQQLIN